MASFGDIRDELNHMLDEIHLVQLGASESMDKVDWLSPLAGLYASESSNQLLRDLPQILVELKNQLEEAHATADRFEANVRAYIRDVLPPGPNE